LRDAQRASRKCRFQPRLAHAWRTVWRPRDALCTRFVVAATRFVVTALDANGRFDGARTVFSANACEIARAGAPANGAVERPCDRAPTLAPPFPA
jgi:hypothetical protein